MINKRNPPKEYRFVKGHSGNPLGRPSNKNERELIEPLIKFNNLVTNIYYRKISSKIRWKKIQKVLNEK